MLGYVLAGLAVAAVAVIVAVSLFIRHKCGGDLLTCGPRLLFDATIGRLFGNVNTDCATYGSASVPTACGAGTEYYGGACYNACPAGYTRTAALTCSRPLTGGPVTDCGRYGQTVAPTACGAGTEFYGSACYRNPDPGRFKRTAACTAWDSAQGHLWTDCGVFGLAGTVGQAAGPQCPGNTDAWGGLCYSEKCPAGTTRTASCTCATPITGGPWTSADFGIATDGAIGQARGPQCPPDTDAFGGLCYSQKCPQDTVRTAACSCAKKA